MSLTQDLEIISQDASEDVIFPPGDIESDEPPLESDLHRLQMTLLIECLEWVWRERNNFYVSGNITVYYSPRQLKSELFRGPDFFVVLNTERKPRKSWVVWEEGGKYPNVIVEVLSPTTADTDRGLKKQIYQDIWRTPNYFWFHPVTLELQGFELAGGCYQALEANERGWLWCQQLQLYFGIYDSKLRLFTDDEQLLPTPQEVVVKEQKQRQEAEQQRQEALQQVTEMEAMLTRYREQFGELS